MKYRINASAILGMISFTSALISSGVKECAEWFTYAKPFLMFAVITGILAAIIYNWNYIRRFTYPCMICIRAWLYEHNLSASKFSRHTYKVYVHFGRSYKRFFFEVQDAFDQYLATVGER